MQSSSSWAVCVHPGQQGKPFRSLQHRHLVASKAAWGVTLKYGDVTLSLIASASRIHSKGPPLGAAGALPPFPQGTYLVVRQTQDEQTWGTLQQEILQFCTRLGAS